MYIITAPCSALQHYQDGEIGYQNLQSIKYQSFKSSMLKEQVEITFSGSHIGLTDDMQLVPDLDCKLSHLEADLA